MLNGIKPGSPKSNRLNENLTRLTRLAENRIRRIIFQPAGGIMPMINISSMKTLISFYFQSTLLHHFTDSGVINVCSDVTISQENYVMYYCNEEEAPQQTNKLITSKEQ